ncbi:MAG TPA: hypothetical protein VKE22_10925 [Haliangiales bacterium]|nr:hypothetical protein [Haliangiales bacterium]
MKVTGPGGPTPPTAAEGVEEVPKGESVQATVEAQTDPVAQLARQIEAGAVTPRQAVGQLIEMAMAEPGVAGLPESTRAELRAALDALAEEDPYVAELLAQMG